MKNLTLLIIVAFALTVRAQDTLSVDSTAVDSVTVVAVDTAAVDSVISDSVKVVAIDTAIVDAAVVDSIAAVVVDTSTVDSVSDVVVPVLRKIKPGLIMSGTNDAVRVMSSYADTEGVEVEAGDTIAYYGEMGDSYIIVENEPFLLDDSVEALGLMPKYLVRVVAYPETVIVDQSIATLDTIKDSIPLALVPLTPKERFIALKNKAIVFVKENKKPVAIGGGAVVGLIVLIAALSGGDDDGGGGAGGGGDIEKMIDPPGMGVPGD